MSRRCNYSTRLCEPENQPNGHILPQKKIKFHHFFLLVPSNNAQKIHSFYLSLRNTMTAEMAAHTRGPALGKLKAAMSV